MYEIGRRIKRCREESGLSQKEFAQKIHQQNSTVSNWERGLTRPNTDVLTEICTVLNVAPSKLLDLHLSAEDMTDQERRVLMAYRTKPELQQAVNILLGIEPESNGH